MTKSMKRPAATPAAKRKPATKRQKTRATAPVVSTTATAALRTNSSRRKQPRASKTDKNSISTIASSSDLPKVLIAKAKSMGKRKISSAKIHVCDVENRVDAYGEDVKIEGREVGDPLHAASSSPSPSSPDGIDSSSILAPPVTKKRKRSQNSNAAKSKRAASKKLDVVKEEEEEEVRYHGDLPGYLRYLRDREEEEEAEQDGEEEEDDEEAKEEEEEEEETTHPNESDDEEDSDLMAQLPRGLFG